MPKKKGCQSTNQQIHPNSWQSQDCKIYASVALIFARASGIAISKKS